MDLFLKARVNKHNGQIDFSLPKRELKRDKAFDLLNIKSGDKIDVSILGIRKRGAS